MTVDWVAVQAMATVFLVLTSAGAIAYAGLQLKLERQYRSVANLEKQLGVFLGETFSAARRRLAVARLARPDGSELAAGKPGLATWDLNDPPVSVFEVLDFYEHLALLVKKGHLDLYDVWHTFYEWAQPVYVDMQLLIESAESSYRDHYNDPQRMMSSMDEIQLKKMHAQKSNPRSLWTVDRIIEHYQYELEAVRSGRTRRDRRPAGASAALMEGNGLIERKLD